MKPPCRKRQDIIPYGELLESCGYEVRKYSNIIPKPVGFTKLTQTIRDLLG